MFRLEKATPHRREDAVTLFTQDDADLLREMAGDMDNDRAALAWSRMDWVETAALRALADRIEQSLASPMTESPSVSSESGETLQTPAVELGK